MSLMHHVQYIQHPDLFDTRLRRFIFNRFFQNFPKAKKEPAPGFAIVRLNCLPFFNYRLFA